MKDTARWLLSVVAAAAFGAACDMCGDEELSSSVAPDGGSVVRTFVRDCGATTPCSTIVEIRRNRRFLADRQVLYVARDKQDLLLLWEGSKRLVVQCAGCPSAGLKVAAWNGTAVELRQTYERPSSRAPP